MKIQEICQLEVFQAFSIWLWFPNTKFDLEKVNESKLDKMGQTMPLFIAKWQFFRGKGSKLTCFWAL